MSTHVLLAGSQYLSFMSSYVEMSVIITTLRHSPYSVKFGVGCNTGLDKFVRNLVPESQLEVFPKQEHVNQKLSPDNVFEIQTHDAMEWVTSGDDSGLLLLWPGCPCPERLVESKSIFTDFGSNPWVYAALAIGNDVTPYVFESKSNSELFTIQWLDSNYKDGTPLPKQNLPMWRNGHWASARIGGIRAGRWVIDQV